MIASLITLSFVTLGQRKENAGNGGIIKPPRLTKQKATSSLLPSGGENFIQPERISLRPKRKLSGQQVQNEEPMQVGTPKAASPEKIVRF